MPHRCDVLIVGGGVVGCAIARELSRFKLRIALLEKEADVGFGTSSRNSGVLHAGFNYAPGSLRALLDVTGNAMMDGLCRDLKVKLRRIGKLTVAFDGEDERSLRRLKEQGEANGVPGLELLDGERMRAIQPGVGGAMALYSPSSSIISPYGLTIGLAENALANGVRFFLGRRVASIARTERAGADPGGSPTAARGRWLAGTDAGELFEAAMVVNASGLFSAEVAAMAGIADYEIYPCRGEYYVLDKRLEGSLRTLVYPAPKKDAPGLGIHLTPTVDGNILVGPSAEYLDDPEDCACTADVMRELRREAQALLPGICVSDYIRSFAGIRPKRTPPEVGGNADFVIEDRGGEAGLINLVGIESPGLTSAPAIAELVREMVGRRIPLVPNPGFDPVHPGREERFSELPAEERAELASKDPACGEIVCRCEKVTKREILDAAANPLGARSLASMKYRSRAGMGRCQGGFCLPRIVRILREELGWELDDFVEKGPSSPLFAGEMRPGPEVGPR